MSRNWYSPIARDWRAIFVIYSKAYIRNIFCQRGGFTFPRSQMSEKMNTSDQFHTNFPHMYSALHASSSYHDNCHSFVDSLWYTSNTISGGTSIIKCPTEFFSTSRSIFPSPQPSRGTRRDNWHFVSMNQRLVTLHTPVSYDKKKQNDVRSRIPLSIRTSCARDHWPNHGINIYSSERTEDVAREKSVVQF